MKVKALFQFVIFPASLLLASCSGPEDKLISSMEEVESIMSDHLDDPGKGVDELIDYMKSNGAELARASAALSIELAEIEKVGDRDERIEELTKEAETARKNLDETRKKFFKALDKDEEARNRYYEFIERMRSLRKTGIEGYP